ncbi:hypothetical protein REPUB_Repub13aG0024000 [Reevesia pubescens]
MIWDSDCFMSSGVSLMRNAMIVKGNWVHYNFSCYICNIFAPCDVVSKNASWSELLSFISNSHDPWCLAGDFNAIRSASDCKGCTDNSLGINEFNNFISQGCLKDIPLNGTIFTWFGPGNKRSRLDRVLVSIDWINKFKNLCMRGLKRSVSDHIPLLLCSDSTDWGPRPFKFLNYWFYDKDFLNKVEERWLAFEVHGNPGYRLLKNLKALKTFLKTWNRTSFGDINETISTLNDQLQALDEIANFRDLSEEEINEKAVVSNKLWVALSCQESLWFFVLSGIRRLPWRPKFMAVLLLSTLPPSAVREPLDVMRLYDAVNVVLSLQNDDGGFAMYELTRSYKWLEMYISVTELHSELMFMEWQHRYVECTSAAIQALASFKKLYPEHRTEEIENCIGRAVEFIEEIQAANGSWYGSWGVCFTYAGWFGIKGLSAAGRTYNNSSSIRKACDFLLSKELATGGWGESYVSCQNKVLIHPFWNFPVFFSISITDFMGFLPE